jgi:hypothetical protein
MNDEPKVMFELTEEEKQKTMAFVLEAERSVWKIEEMFPKNTRGFFQFLLVMRMLQKRFPISEDSDVLKRIAEWIVAGEPEDLENVVPKIMARLRVM